MVFTHQLNTIFDGLGNQGRTGATESTIPKANSYQAALLCNSLHQVVTNIAR